METIALTTLLLPFIGALVVSLAPRQTAPAGNYRHGRTGSGLSCRG